MSNGAPAQRIAINLNIFKHICLVDYGYNIKDPRNSKMEGYRDEKEERQKNRQGSPASFVLLSPIDLQRTNQAGQNARGQQKTQKQVEQKYSIEAIPPMTDRFRFNLSPSLQHQR